MSTEFSPQLVLIVVDKGKGAAFAAIHYGPASDLIRVIISDTKAEIWSLPSSRAGIQSYLALERRQNEQDVAAMSARAIR